MQAMYDSAVEHNLSQIVKAAEDARKVAEGLMQTAEDTRVKSDDLSG